jgi:ADP-ribose pyrophosphatase YjhB (NUDIX family)
MAKTLSGPVVRKIPDGDNRHRLVCDDCGFINYDNPKIVAGALPVAPDGRILICKRAIEPRIGYWTLPAGFLENEETVQEGAAREAWEEAYAEVEIGQMLGFYNIPRISQVQILFRARLLNPDSVRPGPESEDVRLVEWDEIPWSEIAFPSVRWTLEYYDKTRDEETFPPATNPRGEGTSRQQGG